MSNYFREGDKPSATELNAPYTETASLTIGRSNTRREWATKAHFDTSGDKINTLYGISASAGASYSTTSSTFTTVTNGVTSAQIAIGKQVVRNTLFRVNWDTLVGELTLGTDATSADNMYIFRIKVSINSGAIVKYISVAQYSYNGRAATTISAALTPKPINWRSCAGTGIFVLEPLQTIDSIVLEAATGGGGSNTLVVDRFNLSVIGARQ